MIKSKQFKRQSSIHPHKAAGKRKYLHPFEYWWNKNLPTLIKLMSDNPLINNY